MAITKCHNNAMRETGFDYVIVRYLHQKDPVVWRHELQKISTGEWIIQTLTGSEHTPIELLRRIEELRRAKDR